MRGEAPWICDNCGKRRESDTNHWFVLYSNCDGILGITKWSDLKAQADGARHVCGAACRNVLVERFFNFGTFENPKPEPVRWSIKP